jgi:acetyl-CoA carboxylase carboxyl transferase subunit alpha
MLEHSIYSVISPEGCAAILWRSAEKAGDAADALRFTAQDLLQLGLVDEIVPEPLGGAHRSRATTVERVGDAVARHLDALDGVEGPRLKRQRREKFLAMGHGAEA